MALENSPKTRQLKNTYSLHRARENRDAHAGNTYNTLLEVLEKSDKNTGQESTLEDSPASRAKYLKNTNKIYIGKRG